MRIPPLDDLLTWPTPNYTNPPTQGPASLIVNLIFISLVILAVGLRLYCRTSIKPWFGLDDAMIALALLFTIALTVIVILANERYGWDRHIWDIPITHYESANIIAMLAKVVFTFAATFTRLSLCCFYYRLVKDSGILWFRWLVHANVIFTVSLCITFIFLATFLCRPVSYYWQYPPVTEGTCLNEGTTTLVAGILNLVADFACTILPVPLVMRLSMPLKQRFGVCLLFGLGFIVIIAGIVRTYFIWRGLISSYDETWYACPSWIAAAVEIDVGVICACAPALKTLLHFSIQCRTSADLSSLSDNRPEPGTSPHSSRPTNRDFFNMTRSNLLSPRSSLHGGSVRLKDEEASIYWLGRPKTGAKVQAGSGYYSDRWDSMELQSVRPTPSPPPSAKVQSY